MNAANTVVSNDGTPLACWREGQGEPLLLVHGGLCDHLAWYFAAPLLAQHFTVWTYDRRGHGQSGERLPHSVAREFEDVLAVLGAIGEEAHLLGHSAGAVLALGAAERAAGSGPGLRSLIVYDPPFIVGGERERPSPSILREIERLLAAGDRDQALRIAIHETVDLSDAEIDAMQDSSGWEHLRAAASAIPGDWKIWDERFDPKHLARIAARSLVLMGSTSPAWMRASAKAVAAALPHAQLVTIEGQAHSAMITAPELFAGEVIRFAAQDGHHEASRGVI